MVNIFPTIITITTGTNIYTVAVRTLLDIIITSSCVNRIHTTNCRKLKTTKSGATDKKKHNLHNRFHWSSSSGYRTVPWGWTKRLTDIRTYMTFLFLHIVHNNFEFKNNANCSKTITFKPKTPWRSNNVDCLVLTKAAIFSPNCGRNCISISRNSAGFNIIKVRTSSGSFFLKTCSERLYNFSDSTGHTRYDFRSTA